MYEAAGYPLSEDGKTHVPFTPEEKKVIVLKIQAEWGGAFEMFYATEDRSMAQADYSLTAIYGGDSEFFGERVSQYLIFEADGTTKGWSTRFNNSFRLDYTNFVATGDELLLEKIAFCADRAEAEAYIAEDRGEPEPIVAIGGIIYPCQTTYIAQIMLYIIAGCAEQRTNHRHISTVWICTFGAHAT